MPSLTSSPSATRVLARREHGLGDGPVRNADRLAHGVLRRLALSADRQFFSSGSPTDSPIVCQGALIYADGRIYLRNNATKSYDCLSVHDLSKKFYSLPMRPKWLDQEIWVSPLVGEATAPLEGNQQRPALIVLRDDNTVNVYNVETGVTMTSVYLGDSAKFKEMSCNQETASIVVKSTRHRPSSSAPADETLRDVVSFVVFRFPPLKLLVHFVLRKGVFGVSVTDASIHQNLLVVMHSDGQIKAYSLEYILEKFCTNPCNLGEPLSGEELGIRSLYDEVGQRPIGIPVTAEVSHLPPVIFQTKSLHQYLQIGSVPWKYLVSETEGLFKLRDLGTSEAVEDGVLARMDETEQDLICFHMDDSARMMHIADGKCSFYDIVSSEENPNGKLVKTFRFPNNGTSEDPDSSSSGCQIVRSSSGRVIRRLSHFSTVSETRKDVSIDYEDELDILAVLGTTEFPDSDGGGNADSVHTRLEEVTLLDGKSYRVLRKIPVGQVLRHATDVSNVHVTLDRDVLVLAVKTNVKTTAFIMRLRSNEEIKAMAEDAEDTAALSDIRRRRRRARKRQQDARTLRRRSTWNEPFRGRTDESDSESEGEVEVFQTRNPRTRNQSSSGTLQGSETRSTRSRNESSRSGTKR